ncbi:hypothetical protein FACS1894170_09150 [Planctomycetales bacterium]|nr:hypothetical protein FACS1894170_09150 [Planctomycetales bacterium]
MNFLAKLSQKLGRGQYKTRRSHRRVPVRSNDLEDFCLTSFSVGDGNEKVLKEPLILTPKLTESRQYLALQKLDWGIDVIAQTRDELLEELKAELRYLWNHCAELPDEQLGKTMREHKHNLLAAVK